MEGVNVLECYVPHLPLMPGVYALRVGLLDSFPSELFYGEMLKTFSVKTATIPQARMAALGIVYIAAEWSFGGAVTAPSEPFSVAP